MDQKGHQCVAQFCEKCAQDHCRCSPCPPCCDDPPSPGTPSENVEGSGAKLLCEQCKGPLAWAQPVCTKCGKQVVSGVNLPFLLSVLFFPFFVLVVFILRAVYAGPGYLLFVILFPPFTLYSLVQTISFLISRRAFTPTPAKARVVLWGGKHLAILPEKWAKPEPPEVEELKTMTDDWNVFGLSAALYDAS